MLAEDRLQAPGAGETAPLEVRHYGSAPGRYALYDDDGATFDFEGGELSWTELVVERGRGAMVEDVDHPNTFVLFVTTDLKPFPWLFWHDTRLINRILALAYSARTSKYRPPSNTPVSVTSYSGSRRERRALSSMSSS